MATIEIFDKALCCATGVCGPEVDPTLPRFAADLEWLASQGYKVQRYNLAQEPLRFADNPSVKQLLDTQSIACLPVVLIDGQVVSQGEYPAREAFSNWLTKKPNSSLGITNNQSTSCCTGTSCC